MFTCRVNTYSPLHSIYQIRDAEEWDNSRVIWQWRFTICYLPLAVDQFSLWTTKRSSEKINGTYAFKFPAGNLIQNSQFTIAPFCKQTELFSNILQLKRFASRLLLIAFNNLLLEACAECAKSYSAYSLKVQIQIMQLAAAELCRVHLALQLFMCIH